MKLHIANELSLPIDTATQTIAILARKRVGKTYTASVIAEELIKAEIPIVVLDPTGAWWGLRSSADGKHDGFPVVIIGGEHGDLPLEENAGKIIADLVVDHPGYYVIDFSKFEHDSEIRRFATDFGKRFYFRKEQKRFPMQLIVDEADIVMPQHPQKDQTVMLHTYDNIVRRGGIRGIGMILISQRPAVLNKNVLTQCETLIQLQMTGSQDVDAVEHWTRLHGTDAERKQLLSTIATLQRGEAWVWSPSWLQVFKLVHIRQRETFNSSATPKAGEKIIIPQKLAPVDLAELGEQIKATVERAKENDPVELKKEIAKLRREAASKPVEPEKIPFIEREDLDLLRAVLQECDALHEALVAKSAVIKEIREDAQRVLNHVTSVSPKVAPPKKVALTLSAAPIRANPREPANGDISGGARRMLIALAQRDGLSAAQLGVRSGLSSSSGTFGTYLGRLRSSGFIEGDRNRFTITPEGRSALGHYEPLPQGRELLEYWIRELGSSGAARMLRLLADSYPHSLTAEELGETTGMSASSGTFGTYLGKLRTLELIEGNRSALRASPEICE